ncbi:MAG: DUF6491 family protein [Gammaproteobacteria bacterium]
MKPWTGWVAAAFMATGAAGLANGAEPGDTAESSAPTRDVTIPFANRGGIKDWQADSDHGLWVQDVHSKWYYAKFLGTCTGLSFAQSIAFDTKPVGTFDRFSSVIVPREGRCAVQSLEKSGAPPRKSPKKHVVPTPQKEASAAAAPQES